MKSAKALVPAGGNRRRHELEFLPAALEIVETPPSPVGRAIMWTIVALFCCALAWASFGQVDIVATAPGKIVPSGRTKLIQPFEIGVVRAIHVHDGDRVKAGEALVDLDSTMNQADLQHLKADLIASQLDVARLKAAISGQADPLSAFDPPADASPAMVSSQRQFLLDEVAEQRAKLGTIDQKVTQTQAERDSYSAEVAKLEATIPILQQRLEIRKYLSDSGYGSKLTYLETLTDLVERQKELGVQEDHVRQSAAALGGLAETKTQTAAEYRRTRFDELTKAEAKVATLTQDVAKADQRMKLQQLTAPVDGVVQQLAVHTVGGVVTPAEPLLVIVPNDSHLEIEAMVSNSDIGFVHEGQVAEIKVATFPFTRYGLLHGTVLNVSEDAVTPDKSQDKSDGHAPNNNDSTDSGTAGSRDLAYSARVSLDRTQMQVEDKLVNLAPGMAVTVEIKTGSRRIISYLLSPLMRSTSEALRER